MNREFRKKFYKQEILKGIHRVLTELDRDPFSANYGSFDREFWAWATKDFSNIDLQRAIYPLSLIYLNDFQDNVWYQESRVKDWIFAGVNFWKRAQHSDGSFDHHYPNEHSFVGAAFTLYEISQAFMLLDRNKEIGPELKTTWLSAMIKAAEFLMRNDESHGFISNHRIGAACALYSMFIITGEEKYKSRAYFFIESVVKKMSKNEGWLCEYNGFDPGYQTLDIYYLANFYRLSNDNGLLNKIIVPAVKSLIYFFHPDGSVGGEYGSRNCPLYFPAGFEILSTKLPEAEAIAQTGTYAISQGNSPSLLAHDIRNFVPMLSAYTQAFILDNTQENTVSIQMPFEREFERYWPEAGLFIRSDKRLYIIIGCAKGGIIKVFDKQDKKLVASHAGYLVELKNRRQYSNQFFSSQDDGILHDCQSKEVPPRKERSLCFSYSFFLVVPYRFMTPIRFLFFRLFNLAFGRIKFFNNLLRKNITNLFIHRRKKANFAVKRTIVFSGDFLKIIDDLSDLKSKSIKSIRAGDNFTTIYMGSSKYYRHSEKLKDVLSKNDFTEFIRNNNTATVSYIVDAKGLRLITAEEGRG